MFGEAARGFTGFHVLALLFLLQALLQWWLRYRSKKNQPGQNI
jgi:hypothetical protein